MKKVAIFVSMLMLSLCVLQPAHAVQYVTSDDVTSADGRANGAHIVGDFTLTIGNNENIADGDANGIALTTATNNTGSLAFSGTSTVTGVVGSSSSVALRRINAGRADKNVTFSTNVFAVTTVVDSTGTLTFNGDVTGTTVHYAGDGIVQLANNKTLTAAVTTSASNRGSLQMLGNGNVVGQVGASGAELKNVSAGVAGTESIFSNESFSKKNTLLSTGTLTLNGNLTGTTLNFLDNGGVRLADGMNITSAITTSTNNRGSVTYLGASTISGAVGSVAGNDLTAVNINGGIVTLNNGVSDYAVLTTTVNSGGTLKVAATDTITGAVTLAGTGMMDVGTTTTTVSGAYAQNTGTKLKTTVTDSTTIGNVVVGGAPTIAADSTVDVNVAGYVPNGTVYTVVTAGAAGANATLVTDNSAALTFRSSVTNDDLLLTATRDYAGVSTNTNNTAVATGLADFSTGATGDQANVIVALDKLSTSDEFNAALQQLDPDMSGGVNQAAYNSTSGVFKTIGTRLDNSRAGAATGGGQVGYSSGDGATDTAVWVQAFGAQADQDDRSGISGYDATTWGVSSGIDWGLDIKNRVGLGFAYSSSDVDTNGDMSNVDVDAYQGSVYGSHDEENYYINGMFALGWNAYDGSRRIQFAGVDRTADSDYDGMQYTASGEFGYLIPMEGWTLVPLANLTYSHLDLDGYTETGAGSLNLVVNDQDYDFLQSGLGASIRTPFVDGQRRNWAPEFHALWLYEFIQDEASTTARFVNGSTTFRNEGFEPEQSTLNAGGKITLYPDDALSFSLGYDLEYRSDYTSHTGSATVKYEF